MARASGPFLCVTASGTVGKLLTACAWKGVPYVRRWYRPRNPRTPKQVAHRGRFLELNDGWRYLYPEEKELWYALSEGRPMTGPNVYSREWFKFYYKHGRFPTVPFLPSGEGSIPVIISESPLPDATHDVEYSYTFSAGGSPIIEFSIIAGALPDGLSLSSDGVLSGTPTVTGTFTFTVEAKNRGGTHSKEFSLTVV